MDFRQRLFSLLLVLMEVGSGADRSFDSCHRRCYAIPHSRLPGVL